tara:strand:- start:595 stop:2991 length:2397 start_codon:yes stop_codon:yes gene_type:complete
MALNSTSVIKLVDLLCEGPIEGIVNGKKSIFLNETPVADNKGNLNFPKSDVSFDQKFGTRNQSSLAGFKKSNSSIIDISQEIGENYSENLSNAGTRKGLAKYGGGNHIFQITDEDTDSFQLLFTIPQLFCTAMEGVAKGQLFSATIRLRVFVKNKNGKFKRVVNKNITGISTSNYQFKTPVIQLTGTPPYTVKVQKFIRGGFLDKKKKRPRAEEDYEIRFFNFKDIPQNTSLTGTRANRLILTSLIERQDIRTAYPYTACVGLHLSTETFSSLPSRQYLVKGMKVKIPSNATALDNGRLRFNNSAFDGELTEDRYFTTCPVCIFYDLLINKRFGCGEFIDISNLNWVDLYPLSRYANQLVSTPDGNEPRFAINTVIGSQAEAYRVLQNIASIFRGMTYWGSNTVNVVADHGSSANISSPNKVHTSNVDKDPVHLYTNSNVINGVFSYSGSSLKTRSTSIWVSYNDPQNFYKPNVVVVEDYDLIEKYGYNIKEIVAFGCSSKYQAQRMGQWMLNSEKLDGHTVTFQTGLDGLAVLPSQIFAVQDEMRAGVRLSGRVGAGSTTSHIVVDQNYDTSLGTIDSSTDTISLTLANGTVEKIRINAITSDGRIQLFSTPSSVPLQDSVYVIQRGTIQAQKFTCIDVKDDGDGKYTITGLEFNDSIYDIVDNTTNNKAKLDYEDVTAFNNEPTIPTNLEVTNSLIQQQTQSQVRVIFSWSRGINGANVSFRVKYKIGDANEKKVDTDDTRLEIDNVKSGITVEFRVRALSIDSGEVKMSPFAVAPTFTVDEIETLKTVNVPDPLS